MQVTSRTNPDLDGTACAIAYAEYLEHEGKKAAAHIYGKPDREAQFVLDICSVKLPHHTSSAKTILVDTSYLNAISKEIDVQNVVEIIDHRKVGDASAFPNATLQIEPVGAAATLIGEKFLQNDIPISKNSAVLLYAAILSNTINFQANVTTERDKKVAEWLKEQVSVPPDFIHQLFVNKTHFDGTVTDFVTGNFYANLVNKTRVGISQIKVLNAEAFVEDHKQEIEETLQHLKEKSESSHVLLNCIGVETGSNVFVTPDETTHTLIRDLFEKELEKKEKILLRKEIWPRIKEHFER